MGMEICVHLDVCKYPEILWWRFDGDACVENVNMDVRLFSSQSFQFTVFLRSKKMFCFTALGLSLDPVNNIWQIGKKYLFSCLFCTSILLYVVFVTCLFGICGSFKHELAGWENRIQNAEDFSRCAVTLCHILSHCVIFCHILCHIWSLFVTFGVFSRAIQVCHKSNDQKSFDLQAFLCSCVEKITHTSIYQYHSKALSQKGFLLSTQKCRVWAKVYKIFLAHHTFLPSRICQGEGGEIVCTN